MRNMITTCLTVMLCLSLPAQASFAAPETESTKEALSIPVTVNLLDAKQEIAQQMKEASQQVEREVRRQKEQLEQMKEVLDAQQQY